MSQLFLSPGDQLEDGLQRSHFDDIQKAADKATNDLLLNADWEAVRLSVVSCLVSLVSVYVCVRLCLFPCIPVVLSLTNPLPRYLYMPTTTPMYRY